ncbi:hypothetical protein F4861DRAFT_101291 [Xylaria intraflava]|nr:hypothetical protein F4861DRAFT_101291 [Xylaria intraflava]
MIRLGGLRSASRAVAMAKQHVSSLPPLQPVIAPNRLAAATRMEPMAGVARPPFIIQQTSIATKSIEGFRRGVTTQGEKIYRRESTPLRESIATVSNARHLHGSSDSGKNAPAEGSVGADVKTVQELLSLSSVPKEPYWLGLFGTLPYLGTSVSTIYLVWVLNTEWPSSSALANNLTINQETASHLLATLEPIQMGYGAIIISFLGAIHWGLEYAEKAPDRARTRFRYGMGVMAPIVAWPTLFLPVEFALTSQFLAFLALYFADARATVHGWTPAWYGVYRFALTAMVGVAIAISLIGRAKVGDASPRFTGLSERFHQRRGEEYTKKWQDLEQEERTRRKKQAKEEADRKKKEKEEEKEARKQEEAKAGSEEDKPQSDADGDVDAGADKEHVERR